MSVIKEREEGEGQARLVLAGEVDLHSSNALRKELLGFCKKKIERIVCDMRGVTYIDSSGLATLIECVKTAKPYGGALVMQAAQPKVMAVFKLAHLLDFFEFED